MRLKKNLVNKLKLSYLVAPYEKILVEMDPTETLLKYMFKSSRGVLNLTDKQKADLNSDINYLKQLRKWESFREKKIIYDINNQYEFSKKLFMLPDAQQKIYFDKLMEEVFNDL